MWSLYRGRKKAVYKIDMRNSYGPEQMIRMAGILLDIADSLKGRIRLALFLFSCSKIWKFR